MQHKYALFLTGRKNITNIIIIMERRKFLQQTALAGAGVFAARAGFGKTMQQQFPVVRVPIGQRRFTSPAVEKLIAEIQANAGNKELAWLFNNCFPNTLDTTVEYGLADGKPDTFVITGDIDAMWLRDSTAQITPYLPLCKEDANLKKMIEGVIRRQNKCIILDPYANAFYKDGSKVSEWKKTDITDMKPGIHERKWEIDSLCYPVRLAYLFWKQTGDTAPFDEHWKEAMTLIVKTFKEQQRFTGEGPYSFQRTTAWATDGVPLGGYGYPCKPNGLIRSMFRPSDDATIFPYLIPSNFFAVKALGMMAEMWEAIGKNPQKADEARTLAKQVYVALQNVSVMHPKFGRIFPYEVNGYGSINLMDDANVPSLLAMPYLETIAVTDITYGNTRRYVLSEENPFFFKGTLAEGVGSPHTGLNRVWPIGITIRGLTSRDPKEMADCLEMLRISHAGTGFMHESFDPSAPITFSRKWFAWANTLFGEFIWKVYRENRDLLKAPPPPPPAVPVSSNGKRR